MVYSTSRCPHCGQVIKRQTNPVHEIGSPFEHCSCCGSAYLNAYKEEWITKSPVKRFFFFLQIYVWARAILLPFLLMAGLVAIFDMDSNILPIICPILSVVWLTVGYFIHKKANREEIAASLQRTNDASYVSLLKRAGYKVYLKNESCLHDTTEANQEKEIPQKTEYDEKRSCNPLDPPDYKNHRKLTTIITIIFSLLCIVLGAMLCFQAHTINELQDDYDAVNELCNDLWNEIEGIGYIVDGSEHYHYYTCYIYSKADEYWAHNVEYCEYIGYSRCPICW